MIGAIQSEVRTVLSTRPWCGVALGMAALVGSDQVGGPADDPGTPFARLTVGTDQLIYNTGMVQSHAVPVPLGILLITTEYRHKTIAATFLAVLNRWTTTTPKVVAVLLVVAVYALVQMAASVGEGASILALVKGVPTMLGDSGVQASGDLVAGSSPGE